MTSINIFYTLLAHSMLVNINIFILAHSMLVNRNIFILAHSVLVIRNIYEHINIFILALSRFNGGD